MVTGIPLLIFATSFYRFGLKTMTFIPTTVKAHCLRSSTTGRVTKQLKYQNIINYAISESVF